MSGINRRQLFGSAAATATGLVMGLPAFASDPVKRTGKPHLKLGLAAYSYRDYLTGKTDPKMDLMEFIDRAVAMGVDGVELTSYYFPKEITAEYICRLKHKCHLLGVDVSGSPIATTFTVPKGPERDKAIAHCKQWIDHASLLGSNVIRVFAGNLPKGLTLDEAQQNTIECLEECCDYTKSKGVFLALENHGGIVAEADSLLKIVKGVKSDWCGINLDTGNFRTEDPYGDLARCAPYALVVQVKTEIQPKGKPKMLADLPREMKILRDAGYRGYVTLEYEAAENPLVAVPRIIGEMRAMMG